MLRLADNLADLTALRDHDALDHALVSAMHDVLQPQSTAIYRAVGEAGGERWLTSAHLTAGQATSRSDRIESGLDALPRPSDRALRSKAVASRQMQQTGGTPCVTVFPLDAGVGAVGALEIATPEPLSEASCGLARAILRLYVNIRGLLDDGERDALTELLNRKTFDGAFLKATVAQQSAAQSSEDERRGPVASGSYWIAMIDIDHFKRVNDNFGHLIGDEVLLLLARLMRSCFRFYDQLYRFGGEEFVVLMRCNSELEAAAMLERLRHATETHRFPQVGTISISIGFTKIRTGDTPSAAFERADKALYHAKAHGRNQICNFAALIASGALVDKAVHEGRIELF